MDPTLIFFAALAAFVCYQLYTVLGRQDEDDDSQEGEAPFKAYERRDAASKAALEDNPLHNKENETALNAKQPQWVKDIRQVIPDFDGDTFLSGAKSAYELIVDSFATGNLADVKAFIDPNVYKAFDGAVTEREKAEQNYDLKFVGIGKADVVENATDKGYVRVTVDFESDQIRVTHDKDGNVVDGDPNRIDFVRDRWTFAKKFNSRDPNWVLVATGGTAAS